MALERGLEVKGVVVMSGPYAVVTDLETTGLDDRKHDIIQISRVVVDLTELKIVDKLTMDTYATPRFWYNWSVKAMEVNHISIETLEECGVSLWVALGLWCRDISWDRSYVTAWGTDFEMRFLESAFDHADRVRPFSYHSYDVRSMYQYFRMVKGQVHEGYIGLREAIEHEGLSSDPSRYHGSLYDAEQTAKLLIHMLQEGVELWNSRA